MNIKNISLVLVSVLLAVGISTVIQKDGTTEKIIERTQTLGVSGPEINSDYVIIGGVPTWYRYSASPIAATSTICSLQSPAATSTLKSATFDTSFASSSALLVEIGVGANSNATTTRLAMWTLPASGKVTLNATTTALETTLVDGIVAPNRYVNFNIAGVGGTSGSAPTGSCSAVFQQI